MCFFDELWVMGICSGVMMVLFGMLGCDCYFISLFLKLLGNDWMIDVVFG